MDVPGRLVRVSLASVAELLLASHVIWLGAHLCVLGQKVRLPPVAGSADSWVSEEGLPREGGSVQDV